MPIDVLQSIEIIEVMENFLEGNRPPEEMRNKLDLGYKLEGQSILIFEIRPRWDKPSEKIEPPVAKATFVKSKNYWKVFWMRSDLKWYPYPPQPIVRTVGQFCKLVEEDKHHCFYG